MPMTETQRELKRLERSLVRKAERYMESVQIAVEMEAAGTIVSDFPPSRYALGAMLKIEQPHTYHRTDKCSQGDLRAAEAIAFHDGRAWLAGLIAYYRHARFGADHPDGILGEFFGDLITK